MELRITGIYLKYSFSWQSYQYKVQFLERSWENLRFRAPYWNELSWYFCFRALFSEVKGAWNVVFTFLLQLKWHFSLYDLPLLWYSRRLWLLMTFSLLLVRLSLALAPSHSMILEIQSNSKEGLEEYTIERFLKFVILCSFFENKSILTKERTINRLLCPMIYALLCFALKPTIFSTQSADFSSRI